MKVLILEDDPALRFALAELLEDTGHATFPVKSISEAREVLDQIKPDALLLDLMIGHEATTEVADLAAYRFPDADVVYLTGSGKFPNGELFEISQNTSMVLRKPTDFREIEAKMAHLEMTQDRGARSHLSGFQLCA